MRLPVFTLTFPHEITPAQIPQLRHALITRAYAHHPKLARHYLHPDLFSNEDAYGAAYDRYPLIQYKTIGGQAAVLGIAAGAQALALLWECWEDAPPISPSFGGGRGEAAASRQKAASALTRKGAAALWKEIKMAETAKPRRYTISRWLPCNQRDAPAYGALTTRHEKEAFLREKLSLHLLKLSHDLCLGLPSIALQELAISSEGTETFRAPRPRPLLDLSFTARLRLPDGIGLGNSPAFGYGVCMREKA